jgi:hypothetical protein
VETATLCRTYRLEETLEHLAPPRMAGTPRAEFLERLRGRWTNGVLNQAVRPHVEAVEQVMHT